MRVEARGLEIMAPAGLKGLRMRSRSRFEIRIVRVVVDATESSIGRCCGGEAAFFGAGGRKKMARPSSTLSIDSISEARAARAKRLMPLRWTYSAR